MTPSPTATRPRTPSRYLGDGQSLLVLILSVLLTLVAVYDLFLLTAIAQ